MNIREEVLDILEEIAESDIVKTNPDIRVFDEGIIDSLATVVLLMNIQERLDIDVTITDFDRETWATPNMIVDEVEKLQ
ncbi:D-alanine--poly(phosphoribitol) ligase subunit DltC [Macrococcus equipercicus]|uniref:D-alanyl carrier protein n=1 Tax=Macrococcus equipercicus TaxID=69967 RepID=A0A9Q9BXG4_9STAP|nr:D-alanine--poly(phosphoribitol) ligase subunit DltC [Macrococcus equipercicus]KAA1042531.1 D-alanine--poly(phosphoribitol) ligase subunit DltC [Macrococcus equipercicus]UTH14392.1 D-alanine--poly(phosphoribitol) ligase subunit DltC [Macrococcus equipercicus]